MKSEQDARALAEEMVKIGTNARRKTIAVISDMNQPLGYAVGNALEVREAIDTLRGRGPADFVELCLTLGTQMLLAGGKAETEEEAKRKLLEVIENRKALDKLAEFVQAQGGDSRAVYEPELLPQASLKREVKAPKTGYINRFHCDEIGICSLILGGGRETKESKIDLSVGLVLRKKAGDFVNSGDTIAILHGQEEEKLTMAEKRFLAACEIGEERKAQPGLIRAIIR